MDLQHNLQSVYLFQKRLWPYIKPYRRYLFLCLFLIMVSTFMAILSPWLLGYLVDHVFVAKKPSLLIPLTILILTVNAIRSIMSYKQSYLFTWLGQKSLHDLRQDLFRQYLCYPIQEFNTTPTGKLVTRLVNDTASLQDLFTNGLAIAFGNLIMVFGILLWLICLDVKLGLICISVYPIMILLSKRFASRIRNAFQATRAALSRMNAFIAENISGMWVIQIFNKHHLFNNRFQQISKEYTGYQIKTIECFAYFQPTITILSSISMSLLIWYGGFQALHQTISLGLLIAFMTYLQSLFSPIRDITEKFNLFITAIASCERIFEFIDRPQESGIKSLSATPKQVSFKGDIEFQNVSFGYPGHDHALHGISFSISPGERIGLIGHTGAGKTTICALLMRFYDLSQGRILIDGKDISQIPDKRILRQSIGYIQQEPFLFSGTIADNIFLWDKNQHQNFEKLPDFIKEPFEKGYLPLTKEVYQRGANLSAGERQMVAFIRTLIHNPSLLIFDEATAHLDSLTEQWIEKASAYAFHQRTVIIIAHRLTTLKSVDRIFILDHGRLVDSRARFDQHMMAATTPLQYW